MDMEAIEKRIQITKTARYFKLGTVSPKTKRLWIVLHGYGQLANYFIKHFEALPNPDTCVIAPEGLSRFYLGSNWERVGASWMTKENRLDEIEDYVQFLDAICAENFAQSLEQPEIVLLGFSQGTATAWRWLLKGKYKVSHLILWAGTIGQENPELLAQKLGDCSFHLVIGDKDEYVSLEEAERRKADLEKRIPSLKFWQFKGGHRIDGETLLRINADLG